MGELYNPFPKLPKNIRQIGDTDQVVRLQREAERECRMYAVNKIERL